MPKKGHGYTKPDSFTMSEKDWFDLLLRKLSGESGVLVPFVEYLPCRVLDPAHKNTAHINPVFMNSMVVRVWAVIGSHNSTVAQSAEKRKLFDKRRKIIAEAIRSVDDKKSRLRKALIAGKIRKLTLEIIGFEKGLSRNQTFEYILPEGAR